MKETIAATSLIVNLMLAGVKVIMGYLSSSVSVLSEGLHSGMDVLSSGINLLGLREAKKPVDKEHPYGHYKFEVLSGFFITLILFVTGAVIIYKAVSGMLLPGKIKAEKLVLGVMLLSVLVNEIMSRLKLYYGKKENSISLLSDGVHSRIDVWTSLSVFIGLILNKYWVYTDSLLALLIGIYIIGKSFSLGKEATDSLLDVSAGENNEDKIRAIAKKNNIVISELKTQKKGATITANLIIKLPSDLTVEKAAIISDKLKKDLIEGMVNLSYVAVQLEKSGFSTNFFKARETLSFNKGFNMGFGWQGRLQCKEENSTDCTNAETGNCVCVKCGFKEEHKKGIPCSYATCPKCGSRMKKEFSGNENKKRGTI